MSSRPAWVTQQDSPAPQEKGIIHYVAFCVWIFSLSVMVPRSIRYNMCQSFIPFCG
jgi:hypothetical protein